MVAAVKAAVKVAGEVAVEGGDVALGRVGREICGRAESGEEAHADLFVVRHDAHADAADPLRVIDVYAGDSTHPCDQRSIGPRLGIRKVYLSPEGLV